MCILKRKLGPRGSKVLIFERDIDDNIMLKLSRKLFDCMFTDWNGLVTTLSKGGPLLKCVGSMWL